MILNLRFNVRWPLFFAHLCVLYCLFSFCSIVRADELHLKDGRVIEAEEIWETGETIWYRKGKLINSVAKTEVLKITKPKPPAASENPNAEAATPVKAKSKIAPVAENSAKTESKSALPAELNEPNGPNEKDTRKIARIFLKGGVQIDADSVWESGDRVGYHLGKMQTFIDRSEVERIVRDVSITEQKPADDLKLRYTTGNRGLDQLILMNADKHGVDPTLIYLVMREESRFNYRAVSRVGARGLMQLMPETARRLGVRNIHDPVENVDAGSRYLRNLLEMFNGDLNLALAGYNAGENAVLKFGRRVPPYRETLNYVWRINTAYRHSLLLERKQK